MSFFKKIYFGNKKTKAGLALSIEAQKIANIYTEKELLFLKKTKTYQTLSSYFPDQYVKAYFSMSYRKLILDQIFINVIKAHDTNQSFILKKKQILFLKLKFNFKFFLKTIISNLKNLSNRYYITTDIIPKLPKIGIWIIEGVNTKLRSDISWLKDSGIKNNDIIFFGKNVNNLIKTKPSKFSLIKKFRIVDLLSLNKIKLSPEFKEIKRSIVKINFNNNEDKWLLSESLILINEINFWKQIFIKYNIKINIDGTENSITPICKQIAIKQCLGLSIGKMRSYPIHFLFYQYWPNDFFFAWGPDGANEVLNSNNAIDDVLVSGFPYKLKFTNKTNSFFTILILDNTFSNNLDLKQVIHTSFLSNIYKELLYYLLEDHKIKIIFKTKKKISLPIEKSLLNKCLLTKRLEIINQEGAFSANLVKKVELVVSTSFYTPTALLECVINNVRGVFIDYSNLKSVSRILYNKNYKNIVFSDISEMLAKLKKFRNDPLRHKEFGCWSKVIDNLDPFQDNEGSVRVGCFIKTLLDGFKKQETLQDIKNYSKKLYVSNINKNYKLKSKIIFSKL